MAVITWKQNNLGKWEANGSIEPSWEQIYHSPEMRARLVASGQLHSVYLNQKSPAEQKYELTGWTGQERDLNFPQTPQTAITANSNGNGIAQTSLLDGEVFGINKKLLLAGAIAWFILKGK